MTQLAPSKRTRTALPGQRLITGKQIEAEIGLPYRSTYDLYIRGLLEAVRFPGSRRLWFERRAIEALIDASKARHV